MALFQDRKNTKGQSEIECEIAKKWALANGFEGTVGGWIYKVGGNRAICQGWSSFFQQYKYQILDEITAELTVFGGFRAFAGNTYYRPTLHNTRTNKRAFLLAEHYDAAQKRDRTGRTIERS